MWSSVLWKVCFRRTLWRGWRQRHLLTKSLQGDENERPPQNSLSSPSSFKSQPLGEEVIMRKIRLLAPVTLSLIALVVAYSQSPLQSPQTRQTATATPRFTIERQVGTQ